MELSPEEIRAALNAALARPEWVQSSRMSQFLRFVVDRTLAGQGSSLKETVVGVEVFGRDPGYDPKVDPVVRVEARRLRLKLQEYYAGSGSSDTVRVVLPKGTYQPRFERGGEAPGVEAMPVVETVRSEPALVADVVPVPEPRPNWRGPALVVAGAAAAIAVGLWLAGRSNFRAASTASTPRLLTGNQGYNRGPAFSPDGGWVAFSRNRTVRQSHIFIQSTSGGEARQLTAESAFDNEPAWSPDGLTLAFLREVDRGRFAVMLRQADPSQSAERRIAEVALRSPIDWLPDGKSILACDRDDASSPSVITVIQIADGRKRQVTSPPKGTPGDTIPRVSPEGRSIAFVRSTEASVQDVYTARCSAAANFAACGACF